MMFFRTLFKGGLHDIRGSAWRAQIIFRYVGLIPFMLLAAVALRAADLPQSASPNSAPPSNHAPLLLDDKPEPFVPSRVRTEAELDHLEALSLFATGRACQRRGENAAALRYFERALRRDPKSAAVAREIVDLAFSLNRYHEAVRYALKTLDLQEDDPLLLRRLGVYLTEVGDWKQAIKLYERALRARVGPKDNAADILFCMEMGRLYHIVDDYKNAADCFARVLDALGRPKDFDLDDKLQEILLGPAVSTYNLIGECFLEADRPAEALAVFEKSNKAAPNKGLMQYRRASVLAAEGKTEQALAVLETCFAEKSFTQTESPYELLAKLLEKLGKKADLPARLEKLLAADPENVPLGYFLAGVYRQSKQYDKAEPLYRALLRTAPTLGGYRDLIDIYLKTKQTEGLLSALGDIVENASVLEALETDILAIAKDAGLLRDLAAAAKKRLQAGLKKLEYGAAMALGILEMDAQQFDSAGEFFELALLAKPEKAGELLMVWGIGLMVEERFDSAAKVFQRGIDLKALPADNPLCYFYLAGALGAAGRIDEALAAAQKAAAIKPDSLRYQSRVAWVLFRGKHYPEALITYTALVDKFDSDRGNEDTRAAMREARLVISGICVILDQLSAAEEWLEQVLDEFPDDVAASNDLGYLWADQGKRLERSQKMVQWAVKAEPKNAAFLDSLGWVYFRLGRDADALAELQKAAALSSDPLILDHLGDVYAKVGEPQQAADAWLRAFAGFQKDKEEQKAKLVEKKLQQHS
jgi:tetratricopeptide (TPR) repeat protein